MVRLAPIYELTITDKCRIDKYVDHGVLGTLIDIGATLEDTTVGQVFSTNRGTRLFNLLSEIVQKHALSVLNFKVDHHPRGA